MTLEERKDIPDKAETESWYRQRKTKGLISKGGLLSLQDKHLKKKVKYILEATNRYCQKSARVPKGN